MAQFSMIPQDLNWESSDSLFLHNPRLPDDEKKLLSDLQSLLPNLSSCIWVLTSGSTSLNQYKWIALSKAAFLASARSVNQHIQSNDQDIWLNPLPSFHVGGLAIWARAYLSKAQVIEFNPDEKWDPHRFVNMLEANAVTLCSLVPAQVFDLVHLDLKCPDSLRTIFVGGGAMSEELYMKARSLGYPLLPTYGMTEACSQIATASLESLNENTFPNAEVLSHLQVRKSEQGILEVRGGSMLEGVAYIENNKLRYCEHKKNSWYGTDDLGEVNAGYIKVLGRRSELVKVSGELVSLPKLRNLLAMLSDECKVTLFPIPDERTGHSVSIVFQLEAIKQNYFEVLDEYNKRVAPYERATQVYFVKEIPKTALGKIKSAELQNMLGV